MAKIHFATATAPPQLARPKLWMLPVGLAVLNGGLALTQLATFETFTQIIGSYSLVPGQGATALALVITALEILSLPALLRLKLSPAMRIISTAAVFLVPLLWLQLTAWQFISGFILVNPGYFGSLVSQPYGWWLIVEVLVYLGVSFVALQTLGGDKLLGKKAQKPASK